MFSLYRRYCYFSNNEPIIKTVLEKAAEEVGLKINEDKTKYMLIRGRLPNVERHFKIRTETGKIYVLEKVN